MQVNILMINYRISIGMFRSPQCMLFIMLPQWSPWPECFFTVITWERNTFQMVNFNVPSYGTWISLLSTHFAYSSSRCLHFSMWNDIWAIFYHWVDLLNKFVNVHNQDVIYWLFATFVEGLFFKMLLHASSKNLLGMQHSHTCYICEISLHCV